MRLPELTCGDFVRQLLTQCKMKAASVEQLSERRFQIAIPYYPGDPRTLTDKLYKAGILDDCQAFQGITWQWNGPGNLQTLWVTLRP